MKQVALAIALFFLVLIGYLILWPVPIKPVSWNAPMPPGDTGTDTISAELAGLNIIPLIDEEGPEYIVIGKDGKLYTTVASGKILRMNPDGSAQEVYINTGGRILGFDFDASGNIIAAAVDQGLISISPDKEITVLTDNVYGDPIRYAGAVVVAKSGKIYFSDASTRFAPKDWGGVFQSYILDIMEQSSTGRILEYEPKKNITRLVAKGFSFPKGIALSRDEQHLFVNETGKYRVWKISVNVRDMDLSNPSGLAKILFDNLPGYPYNLMRGLEGKFWVGFAKRRNFIIDKLSDKPDMRRLLLRLPRMLWPVPKAYGHVIAFTENGQVVTALHDPKGTYPETTGVTEIKDRLYVQSLQAKGVGWLPK